MATLNDFLPNLKLSFTDCPNIILLGVLKEVIRDFCQKTRIIRDSVSVSVLVGTKDYTLTPPVNTDIAGLVYVKTSSDTYYTNYSFAKPVLTLNNLPTSTETLTVRVAVKPDFTSTSTVTDILHDDYSEAIEAGVKAKLLSIPNKSWTDHQLAMLEGSRYRTGIGNAVASFNNQYGAKELGVTMREFI